MQSVTQKASRAFINLYAFKSVNTIVEADENSARMYLHGHLIAQQYQGVTKVNFCSYSTAVTKERINGLCEMLGKRDHFSVSKGELLNNGTVVSNDEWIEL